MNDEMTSLAYHYRRLGYAGVAQYMSNIESIEGTRSGFYLALSTIHFPLSSGSNGWEHGRQGMLLHGLIGRFGVIWALLVAFSDRYHIFLRWL